MFAGPSKGARAAPIRRASAPVRQGGARIWPRAYLKFRTLAVPAWSEPHHPL
jgi:hypothetical protein